MVQALGKLGVACFKWLVLKLVGFITNADLCLQILNAHAVSICHLCRPGSSGPAGSSSQDQQPGNAVVLSPVADKTAASNPSSGTCSAGPGSFYTGGTCSSLLPTEVFACDTEQTVMLDTDSAESRLLSVNWVDSDIMSTAVLGDAAQSRLLSINWLDSDIIPTEVFGEASAAATAGAEDGGTPTSAPPQQQAAAPLPFVPTVDQESNR